MFTLDNDSQSLMAKINTGILGGFNGPLGPVVGYAWKGKACMRTKALSVLNPNTEAQQMWRYRFKVITQLGASCLTFIHTGFHQQAKEMTESNVFMAKNICDVFTGTWPNLTLAYSKLVFAAGSLDLPFNPAATASETAITFTWTDNSGVGNASATDKANVLIYNKSQHTAQTVMEAAARTAATFSYTFPTAWAGDEVELYFYMSNAAATNNSPSVYLGNITL
ncbi:MAG: DUF6266 family protein [Bacteroidales bacterium]|nr:DUF6266 family protein [Bacteroidales bacterium]